MAADVYWWREKEKTGSNKFFCVRTRGGFSLDGTRHPGCHGSDSFKGKFYSSTYKERMEPKKKGKQGIYPTVRIVLFS